MKGRSTLNWPFYAATGALIVLSMLMYCTNAAGFAEVLFPTYMTEAILFFALNQAIQQKRISAKQGFVVFLMSFIWLLNQILHWSGLWGKAFDMLAASTWILFFAQLTLAYGFFTGTDLIGMIGFRAGGDGATWKRTALFLLLFYAVAKIWLNLAVTAQFMWMLWGLAVALLALGALMKNDMVMAAGTALAAFVALGVGGSGLAVA